jgi:hypothetical protein
MRKIFNFFKKHFLLNTFFIFLGSLIWFLWRTGTKPSRYVYPCQKIARDNIGLFGPPALIFLFHKLRHNPRFRRNVFLGIAIIFVSVVFMRNVVLTVQKDLAKKVMAQTANNPKGTPRGVMPGRVVWVHDSGATTGIYTDYYNQVNQAKVDAMMNTGVKSLTNQTTVGGAMAKIFAVNSSAKKVAIKVNFNNSEGWLPLTSMDANSQTVIAFLKQLTTAETNVFTPFPQGNIYVYDASRAFGIDKAYFAAAVHAVFPNVHVVGRLAGPNGIEEAVLAADRFVLNSSCSPDYSSGWGDTVPQLIKDVDYMVDMPLLKGHTWSGGATLSLKNYLGNIGNPGNWHPCIAYFGNNTGLVAVYTASTGGVSLDQKTKLIIGDGLYGNPRTNTGPPVDWGMFGNKSPNSIFVSQDVVAADSVMFSTIMQEQNSWDTDGEALLNASANKTSGTGSLGVHENPGLKSGCTDQNNLSCWKYISLDFVPCDFNGTMDSKCSATMVATPTPTPACSMGDVDCSGKVDAFDLVKLILKLGQNIGGREDVDGSGQVNSLDLGILLSHFGQ